MRESQGRRLRWRLRSDQPRLQTEEPCGPREGHPTQEPAAAELSRVLDTHENLPSPVAGQCDTANAGQWTLLPSHEQAQHLTLGVSCCRKPERGTSAGCR